MDNLDNYLERFDPFRDDSDWVSEEANVYADRMQSTLLPHWPTEVLIEWFHRHARSLYRYAFLRFERFRFDRQTWQLDHIPNREAFDDESFCERFMDVESRAENPHDWLAHYMLRHGTWNTPIIMLDNPRGDFTCPGDRRLKSPFHLLEGHRRLSFLNGLRQIGKARLQHDVWIVTLAHDADNAT